MNIPKAIKILERNPKIDIPAGEIAYLDATRLSIEALKTITLIRERNIINIHKLLLGETEE